MILSLVGRTTPWATVIDHQGDWSLSNMSILYSSFFDQSRSVQDDTLTHESLHVATGLDDVSLARELGWKMGSPNEHISKWIADCQKK